MIQLVLVSITAATFAFTIVCACPKFCKCLQDGGRFATDCTNANITRIPDNIPANTLKLILDGNKLRKLGKKSFFERGLSQITDLSLQNCDLRKFESKIFDNLTKLTHLDLSHNYIGIEDNRRMQESMFGSVSLPTLQTLDLSYNKLSVLRGKQFFGAKNLEEINLAHNEIGDVYPTAFQDLDKIKRIYLNSNSIRTLQYTVFHSLQNLKLVNLLGNLWRCDCDIRPFVAWFLPRKIGETPVCQSPAKHFNKTWEQLRLDEFACPPVTEMKSVQRTQTHAGAAFEQFKCQSKGNPIPDIQWEFRNDTQHIPINNEQKPGKYVVTQSPARSEHNLQLSELTVKNISKHDEGQYHCIGSNTIAATYVVFTLHITPTADSQQGAATDIARASEGFSQENVFIVAIVVVAVCLVTAVAVGVFCYFRAAACKRLQQHGNGPSYMHMNGHQYKQVLSDKSGCGSGSMSVASAPCKPPRTHQHHLLSSSQQFFDGVYVAAIERQKQRKLHEQHNHSNNAAERSSQEEVTYVTADCGNTVAEVGYAVQDDSGYLEPDLHKTTLIGGSKRASPQFSDYASSSSDEQHLSTSKRTALSNHPANKAPLAENDDLANEHSLRKGLLKGKHVTIDDGQPLRETAL